MNICKESFHMSHVHKSQKVKGVLMWIFNIYDFHMKTDILADFQICINVPLRYQCDANEVDVVSMNKFHPFF